MSVSKKHVLFLLSSQKNTARAGKKCQNALKSTKIGHIFTKFSPSISISVVGSPNPRSKSTNTYLILAPGYPAGLELGTQGTLKLNNFFNIGPRGLQVVPLNSPCSGEQEYV